MARQPAGGGPVLRPRPGLTQSKSKRFIALSSVIGTSKVGLVRLPLLKPVKCDVNQEVTALSLRGEWTRIRPNGCVGALICPSVENFLSAAVLESWMMKFSVAQYHGDMIHVLKQDPAFLMDILAQHSLWWSAWPAPLSPSYQKWRPSARTSYQNLIQKQAWPCLRRVELYRYVRWSRHEWWCRADQLFH